MKQGLLGLSLIITALTLIYLLFVNLFRGTFIISDWYIISVELSAKIIIEIIILKNKED